MRREEVMRQRFMERLQNNEKMYVLGVNKTGQLPIFSFLIKHPASGLYLHHNFVVSLLNDLFGIQTRGGCACAGKRFPDTSQYIISQHQGFKTYFSLLNLGPYLQSLLGLNEFMTSR